MRLTIGRLAKVAGVHLETIRYYERIGLLPPPPRTAGGHRDYRAEHVKRLTFVRRGRELGFTLDQVRALLALAEDRGRSCAEARRLGLAHLADVRTKISDLRRLERVLNQMVARCADGTLPECPLIEALSDALPMAASQARPARPRPAPFSSGSIRA